MRWFEEQRLNWIKESIEIFGHVNRINIQRKFGISVAQAALDLQRAQARWPTLMKYDSSSRRYVSAGAEPFPEDEHGEE